MKAHDRETDTGGGQPNRSGGRRRSRRGRGGARGGSGTANRRPQDDGADSGPQKGGGNRSQKGRPADHKGDSQGSQKGGSRSQKGGNRSGGDRPQGGKRNRKRRKPSHGGTGFWGDPARLPAIHADIRITDEPAAVPRSLGPPPLPGHEQVAVHYFAAVYDRAVNTAGALAAAGGLIDPESLVDSNE